MEGGMAPIVASVLNTISTRDLFRRVGLPRRLPAVELEQLEPLRRQNNVVHLVPSRVDPIGHELGLERDEDRHLLSEVERHDTELLDRVRAALHSD